jgi:PfaB family protein
MKKFAVTAIDARLASIASIDYFERAVYLGQALPVQQFAEREETILLGNSLACLRKQVNVVTEQIVLLLITNDDAVVSHFSSQAYHSVQGCDNLIQALVVAASFADEFAVAILAVNLLEQADVASLPTANISFADDFSGYLGNEAVAGILLQSSTVSAANTQPYYAVIESFASDTNATASCYKALQQAAIKAEEVHYVEASALAEKSACAKEMHGLISAYQSSSPLTAALSSVRSVVGDCGNTTPLLALVKTVLTVQQRYIAATNEWQKPHDELWHSSPFYFATDARPWYLQQPLYKRYAACNVQEGASNCHIIISDDPRDKLRTNGYLAHSNLVLLPIRVKKKQQIIAALEKFEKTLSATQSLRDLATQCYQQYMQGSGDYVVVLLAESFDDLHKEIQLAKVGIVTANSQGSDWKTPKGSYYSSVPVGGERDIAFLYPGIGAAYVGLGKDLFHLFPEILHPAEQLADDFSEAVKARTLNPRSVSRLSFTELKQLDSRLRNHLSEIAECGVAYACVFTFIFEKILRIKADFATGYSMGEISMYAALGCWQQPGQMSERLANSDTFNHRLSGELQTLRQHWDLPEAKPGVIEQLWETYTLKATAEEVQEACINEDRVYCTIINTPDSLVIGGYPEACQRVIKRIGVRAMALDMPNAIHSPPAFKEYEHMEKLYTMDVTERIDTKMYSSSCYLPVPQRSKAIANSIAKCLCDPVDFPRLINTMHDKGAKVFIEMGPGRSLTSWAEKILKEDKQHVSLPVNAKGTSDELTFMRSIAKMISHGVALDFSCLYHGSLLKAANNLSTAA